MQIPSVRRAAGTFATLISQRPPSCPTCRSPMAMRARTRGAEAGEQYWACSRFPTCRGSRPLAAERVARPSAEPTSQTLFDKQRRRTRLPRLSALRRNGPADRELPRYLAGLAEAGYIGLHRRRVPAERGLIDHLLIGPTGVYVVETKPWRGQLAVDGDRLYVDGRVREGAADQVLRMATAVQALMIGELKPLGVTVKPVLCFDATDLPLLKRSIRGAAVTGRKGLSRLVRNGDNVLAPQQVLAVATAADEILLPIR